MIYKVCWGFVGVTSSPASSLFFSCRVVVLLRVWSRFLFSFDLFDSFVRLDTASVAPISHEICIPLPSISPVALEGNDGRRTRIRRGNPPSQQGPAGAKTLVQLFYVRELCRICYCNFTEHDRWIEGKTGMKLETIGLHHHQFFLSFSAS